MKLTSFRGQMHSTTGTYSAADFMETRQFCPQCFYLSLLCYLPILVMQSGAVTPGALVSLWREGGGGSL